MSNLTPAEFPKSSKNTESVSQTESTIQVPKSRIDQIIKFATIRMAKKIAPIDWITPNLISYLSAILGGLVSGVFIYQQQFLLAVPWIIISGILDNLDGDLAREKNLTSASGEILDSVLDRYVDFCLIAALILVDTDQNLVPGLMALLGTSLVPYIRARSEAAGKSTVTSIGDRTMRTILIILGLLTQQIFGLLIGLAIISNIAALHRFIVAIRDQN